MSVPVIPVRMPAYVLMISMVICAHVKLAMTETIVKLVSRAGPDVNMLS